ncbi:MULTISPECIES: DJ-1/PfpI family protein [unclassified Sinorhizobium]|uniref:DJ-1/PfpI family protein n=1 Tax=unclassified Sinorhizobium TaxID=2613772 RepID=UPI0024C33040|nr:MULTISPECIES: DJ-1/PfpI family protein [unclassified Sinorhizobium]MDK1375619.1 DJ-1/PfpI family protein [Sinorhizobium sp. 6-70]MDK1479512.1 DJ-1/PfpI family protein [Sinorhizobium sp. 6-117]
MRLAIVLTEGFADWECALLMATARTELGLDVLIATPGGTVVTSMGGLHITPHLPTKTLAPAEFDALVLCGGSTWETAAAPNLTAMIHAFHGKDRVVAGICGATLALAASGILNDVDHTGNSAESLSAVAGYRGHPHYRDQPQALRSGRLVTAAGTAPVSFTAEVFHALGLGSAALDDYLSLYAKEHAVVPVAR